MKDSIKMKKIINDLEFDDPGVKNVIKSLLGFATTEYQTGLNYHLGKKLRDLIDKEAQKRIKK